MKQICIKNEIAIVRTWEEAENKNNGVVAEWAFCLKNGIVRTSHDRLPYHMGSDLETDTMHCSIKSARFSLMSGSLCNGLTDFESIWELFASKVKSDVFAYVTQNSEVYLMDKTEFCEFVHNFCGLEKESKKNGGATKIKMRSESKAVLEWLDRKAS